MAHLHLSCMRESLSCSCMLGFSFCDLESSICEIRDSRRPHRHKRVCSRYLYCLSDTDYYEIRRIVVVVWYSRMIEAIHQGFMGFKHHLGSIRPHSNYCISASRTARNLRKDQDRRGCARIDLDPRAGTKRRVVAGISVIIAVQSKAWRGLFSQATASAFRASC